MWIYKGLEKGLEPIAGVPPTDLSDEEFDEYSKWIDLQYAESGSLAKSGLWEHKADSRSQTSESRTSSKEQEQNSSETKEEGK